MTLVKGGGHSLPLCWHRGRQRNVNKHMPSIEPHKAGVHEICRQQAKQKYTLVDVTIHGSDCKHVPQASHGSGMCLHVYCWTLE